MARMSSAPRVESELAALALAPMTDSMIAAEGVALLTAHDDGVLMLHRDEGVTKLTWPGSLRWPNGVPFRIAGKTAGGDFVVVGPTREMSNLLVRVGLDGALTELPAGSGFNSQTSSHSPTTGAWVGSRTRRGKHEAFVGHGSTSVGVPVTFAEPHPPCVNPGDARRAAISDDGAAVWVADGARSRL